MRNVSNISILDRRFYDIGVRLKQLRGVMSQKEFSKKIGVPVPSYQRYESGERLPKGHVLAKIAEKTFVTPEWILRGDYESRVKKDNESIRFVTAGDLLTEEIVRALRSIHKKLSINVVAEILDVDPDNPLNRLGHPTTFYLAIMYLVQIFRESKLDEAKVEAILAQLRAFLPKKHCAKIKRNLKK